MPSAKWTPAPTIPIKKITFERWLVRISDEAPRVPSIRTENVRGLTHSLKVSVVIVTELKHGWFLPNSFQFIIPKSSYHSTRYTSMLDTDSVVKWIAKSYIYCKHIQNYTKIYKVFKCIWCVASWRTLTNIGNIPHTGVGQWKCCMPQIIRIILAYEKIYGSK
jgi:hypothetical protein